MTDKLVFIGGAQETVPAMRKALDLGYELIVVDGNPKAPGIEWAAKHNQSRYAISCINTEKIIEAFKIKKEKIGGVVAVACDVGPTVSRVAKAFDCVYLRHEVALLGWDKQELKMWVSPQKIKVPGPLLPGSEKKFAIIKPADSRGARGVFRVPLNENGFVINSEAWAHKAASYSDTGRVIVEEFVAGPQISTESIVYNGDVLFTGITDRNYEYERFDPYLIEDGGNCPTRYTSYIEPIKDFVTYLIYRLGIMNGTVKCDLVLDENADFAPTLIEAAFGRMSGGYSCTHHLEAVYNTDFLAAAFALAMGDDPTPHIIRGTTGKHSCGRWEMPGEPTNSNEYGDFYFGVGNSEFQAKYNAELKRGKGEHIDYERYFVCSSTS